MRIPNKKIAMHCAVVIILSTLMVSCDDDDITGNDDPFRSGSTESFYLTMPDGVRLALDVTIPQPLGAGVQVPTIVTMTRYWRGDEGGGGMSDIFDWRKEAAARRGYAFVVIDERGTGASFGVWPYPWSEASLEDFAAVVDWVVAQEWSDGQVGAWGISYLGMAAQHLAALNHTAVKAAVPTFTQYDLYTDLVYPGGIFLDTYMRDWHEANVMLDSNQWPGREVKRVDADPNGTNLEEAVSEHADNGNTYELSRSVTYRDRRSAAGVAMDDVSAHTRRVALEQSGVALYHWGSWMDQGNAHSALTRFLTLSNPQQAVIGPWAHGGFGHASPYSPPDLPPEPSEAEQWDQILAFLDSHLKRDNTANGGKVLHYYTYGAEEWRTTSVWPVAGTTMETLYLTAGNALSASAPTDPTGSDVYTVDFTATTGAQTRWQDGPVGYGDRRSEDLKLLTYTTAPLAEDIEITGYPIVTLYVSSTHSDGAFFVYLEDVDPAGQVAYITEGQLRALHRKISTENAPYELLVPYHSFMEQDAEPLVPGEVAEISFGLLPTSIVIRAGHRLRIAIAGHDAAWFARVPQSGDPEVTVMRNQTHASRIALPLVRAP